MSEPSQTKVEYDVIIVGAGVAGASAAYHLAQSGVTNMLIIDAGRDAGQGVSPRQSGSATMPDDVAPCVKMMVQLYAGSSEEFARHHGLDGCKRYLTATREGLAMQKTIAREVWKDCYDEHVTEMGSYYVAYERDWAALRREFETLQSLEACPGIQWIEKEELQSLPGLSTLDFAYAIFFPNDAVIDSSYYAKTLMHAVVERGVTFWTQTKVAYVNDKESFESHASVVLDTGKVMKCSQAVVATGGLFPLIPLNGLLKPCYSYLVHVPTLPNLETSANFYTRGFTHDWCFTNGKVRCSGEDHFSAYKPPLCRERCRNLSQWTLRQYNCPVDDKDYAQQYGVYSETPDLVPLIGTLTDASRICYLVGCNAWGQTILSYCSSLIPGLLGYQELDESQRDSLRLISIRRFSHLDHKRARQII